MEGKLRELTDRIYQEGVARARQEAQLILKEAHAEAAQIRSEAAREAEHLRIQSREDAAQLRLNINSELQISARQALSDLKQKISGLITAQVVSRPVQTAMQDDQFLRQIILAAIANWKPESQTSPDIQILLPENLRAELDQFLKVRTLELGREGIHIRYDQRLQDGFKIGPVDEGFIISFTSEDFERFFRGYLRPQIDKFLFED
jgi:V/A-type H+-transporting ATPase subunit E